jgi:hypothetical protein
MIHMRTTHLYRQVIKASLFTRASHLYNTKTPSTPSRHYHIKLTMAATMKAFVTVEGKKAEVKSDVPIPQPAFGEILVKVHTVAQNPTDWKAVR